MTTPNGPGVTIPSFGSFFQPLVDAIMGFGSGVVDVAGSVSGADVLSTAIAGDMWPDGDPGQLEELGRLWMQVSDLASQALDAGAGGMGQVLGSYRGTTGQAAFEAWLLVVGDDESGLIGVAQASAELGGLAQRTGHEILLAQYRIWFELFAAVMSMFAIISSVWIFAGPGGAAAAEEAARPGIAAVAAASIRAIMSRLRNAIADHGVRVVAGQLLRQAPRALAGVVPRAVGLAPRAIGAVSPRGIGAVTRNVGGYGLHLLNHGAREAVEETFIEGGARLAAGLQTGDLDYYLGGNSWRMIATASLAGFIGGAGSAALFGPWNLETDLFGQAVPRRILDQAVPVSAMSRWLSDQSAGWVSQAGRRGLVSGFQNFVTNTPSSLLAQTLLTGGEFSLGALRDGYLNGALPSFATGMFRSTTAFAAETVAPHIAPANGPQFERPSLRNAISGGVDFVRNTVVTPIAQAATSMGTAFFGPDLGDMLSVAGAGGPGHALGYQAPPVLDRGAGSVHVPSAPAAAPSGSVSAAPAAPSGSVSAAPAASPGAGSTDAGAPTAPPARGAGSVAVPTPGTPAQGAPVQDAPSQSPQGQTAPAQGTPAQTVPAQTAPAHGEPIGATAVPQPTADGVETARSPVADEAPPAVAARSGPGPLEAVSPQATQDRLNTLMHGVAESVEVRADTTTGGWRIDVRSPDHGLTTVARVHVSDEAPGIAVVHDGPLRRVVLPTSMDAAEVAPALSLALARLMDPPGSVPSLQPGLVVGGQVGLARDAQAVNVLVVGPALELAGTPSSDVARHEHLRAELAAGLRRLGLVQDPAAVAQAFGRVEAAVTAVHTAPEPDVAVDRLVEVLESLGLPASAGPAASAWLAAVATEAAADPGVAAEARQRLDTAEEALRRSLGPADSATVDLVRRTGALLHATVDSTASVEQRRTDLAAVLTGIEAAVVRERNVSVEARLRRGLPHDGRRLVAEAIAGLTVDLANGTAVPPAPQGSPAALTWADGVDAGTLPPRRPAPPTAASTVDPPARGPASREELAELIGFAVQGAVDGELVFDDEHRYEGEHAVATATAVIVSTVENMDGARLTADARSAAQLSIAATVEYHRAVVAAHDAMHRLDVPRDVARDLVGGGVKPREALRDLAYDDRAAVASHLRDVRDRRAAAARQVATLAEHADAVTGVRSAVDLVEAAAYRAASRAVDTLLGAGETATGTRMGEVPDGGSPHPTESGDTAAPGTGPSGAPAGPEPGAGAGAGRGGGSGQTPPGPPASDPGPADPDDVSRLAVKQDWMHRELAAAQRLLAWYERSGATEQWMDQVHRQRDRLGQVHSGQFGANAHRMLLDLAADLRGLVERTDGVLARARRLESGAAGYPSAAEVDAARHEAPAGGRLNEAVLEQLDAAGVAGSLLLAGGVGGSRWLGQALGPEFVTPAGGVTGEPGPAQEIELILQHLQTVLDLAPDPARVFGTGAEGLVDSVRRLAERLPVPPGEIRQLLDAVPVLLHEWAAPYSGTDPAPTPIGIQSGVIDRLAGLSGRIPQAPGTTDAVAVADLARHLATWFDAVAQAHESGPGASRTDGLIPTGQRDRTYKQELFLGPDNRLHFPGDRPGTFRAEDGALRTVDGRMTTDDNPPSLPRKGRRAVRDGASVRHYDPIGDSAGEVAVRAAVDERNAAEQERRAARDGFGPWVDRLAERGITVDLKRFGRAQLERLVASAESKGFPPEDVLAMQRAGQRYARAAIDLKRASERLGTAGGNLVHEREFTDGELVTGGDDVPGTANNLDRIVVVTGERPTVIVFEEKGAGSGLTSRAVDDPHRGDRKIGAEQGSPEYLHFLLEIDNKLAEVLPDRPELADAMREAILGGPEQLRYLLVHTGVDGHVTAVDFVLDPDRLNRDGIDLVGTTADAAAVERTDRLAASLTTMESAGRQARDRLTAVRIADERRAATPDAGGPADAGPAIVPLAQRFRDADPDAGEVDSDLVPDLIEAVFDWTEEVERRHGPFDGGVSDSVDSAITALRGVVAEARAIGGVMAIRDRHADALANAVATALVLTSLEPGQLPGNLPGFIRDVLRATGFDAPSESVVTHLEAVAEHTQRRIADEAAAKGQPPAPAATPAETLVRVTGDTVRLLRLTMLASNLGRALDRMGAAPRQDDAPAGRTGIDAVRVLRSHDDLGQGLAAMLGAVEREAARIAAAIVESAAHLGNRGPDEPGDPGGVPDDRPGGGGGGRGSDPTAAAGSDDPGGEHRRWSAELSRGVGPLVDGSEPATGFADLVVARFGERFGEIPADIAAALRERVEASLALARGQRATGVAMVERGVPAADAAAVVDAAGRVESLPGRRPGDRHLTGRPEVRQLRDLAVARADGELRTDPGPWDGAIDHLVAAIDARARAHAIVAVLAAAVEHAGADSTAVTDLVTGVLLAQGPDATVGATTTVRPDDLPDVVGGPADAHLLAEVVGDLPATGVADEAIDAFVAGVRLAEQPAATAGLAVRASALLRTVHPLPIVDGPGRQVAADVAERYQVAAYLPVGTLGPAGRLLTAVAAETAAHAEASARLRDAYVDAAQAEQILARGRLPLVRWRPAAHRGVTAALQALMRTRAARAVAQETFDAVVGESGFADTWAAERVALAIAVLDAGNPAAPQSLTDRQVVAVLPTDDADEAYVVHFADGGYGLYRPEPVGRALDPSAGPAVRDLAARVYDEELGLGLVPPTVAWDGPHGPGSLREWTYGTTPGRPVHGYTPRQIDLMAVLHYGIGETDGRQHRYRTAPTGTAAWTGTAASNGTAASTGTAAPIGSRSTPIVTDARTALRDMAQGPVRSDFVAARLGRPLTDVVVDTVLARVNLSRLGVRLRETGLSDAAVTAVLARTHEMMRTGMITGVEQTGGLLDGDGATLRAADAALGALLDQRISGLIDGIRAAWPESARLAGFEARIRQILVPHERFYGTHNSGLILRIPADGVEFHERDFTVEVEMFDPGGAPVGSMKLQFGNWPEDGTPFAFFIGTIADEESRIEAHEYVESTLLESGFAEVHARVTDDEDWYAYPALGFGPDPADPDLREAIGTALPEHAKALRAEYLEHAALLGRFLDGEQVSVDDILAHHAGDRSAQPSAVRDSILLQLVDADVAGIFGERQWSGLEDISLQDAVRIGRDRTARGSFFGRDLAMRVGADIDADDQLIFVKPLPEDIDRTPGSGDFGTADPGGRRRDHPVDTPGGRATAAAALVGTVTSGMDTDRADSGGPPLGWLADGYPDAAPAPSTAPVGPADLHRAYAEITAIIERFAEVVGNSLAPLPAARSLARDLVSNIGVLVASLPPSLPAPVREALAEVLEPMYQTMVEMLRRDHAARSGVAREPRPETRNVYTERLWKSGQAIADLPGREDPDPPARHLATLVQQAAIGVVEWFPLAVEARYDAIRPDWVLDAADSVLEVVETFVRLAQPPGTDPPSPGATPPAGPPGSGGSPGTAPHPGRAAVAGPDTGAETDPHAGPDDDPDGDPPAAVLVGAGVGGDNGEFVRVRLTIGGGQPPAASTVVGGGQPPTSSTVVGGAADPGASTASTGGVSPSGATTSGAGGSGGTGRTGTPPAPPATATGAGSGASGGSGPPAPPAVPAGGEPDPGGDWSAAVTGIAAAIAQDVGAVAGRQGGGTTPTTDDVRFAADLLVGLSRLLGVDLDLRTLSVTLAQLPPAARALRDALLGNDVDQVIAAQDRWVRIDRELALRRDRLDPHTHAALLAITAAMRTATEAAAVGFAAAIAQTVRNLADRLVAIATPAPAHVATFEPRPPADPPPADAPLWMVTELESYLEVVENVHGGRTAWLRGPRDAADPDLSATIAAMPVPDGHVGVVAPGFGGRVYLDGRWVDPVALASLLAARFGPDVRYFLAAPQALTFAAVLAVAAATPVRATGASVWLARDGAVMASGFVLGDDGRPVPAFTVSGQPTAGFVDIHPDGSRQPAGAALTNRPDPLGAREWLRYGPVADAEIRAIFDAHIRPPLDALPPATSPRLVVIGGPSGVGKSHHESRILDEFGIAADRAVLVDVDGLRSFHPGYARLVAEDDLLASQRTLRVGVELQSLVLGHAMSRGVDVVLHTTLAGADWTAALLGRFRAAGYHVTLAVVAAPEAQTRLGVLTRLMRERMEHRPSRYPPSVAQPRMHQGLPVTVARVQDDGLADEVRIFSRQLDTVPSAAADGGPSRALAELLARPWSPDEVAQFRAAVMWLNHVVPMDLAADLAEAVLIASADGIDVQGLGRPAVPSAPGVLGDLLGAALLGELVGTPAGDVTVRNFRFGARGPVWVDIVTNPRHGRPHRVRFTSGPLPPGRLVRVSRNGMTEVVLQHDLRAGDVAAIARMVLGETATHPAGRRGDAARPRTSLARTLDLLVGAAAVIDDVDLRQRLHGRAVTIVEQARLRTDQPGYEARRNRLRSEAPARTMDWLDRVGRAPDELSPAEQRVLREVRRAAVISGPAAGTRRPVYAPQLPGPVEAALDLLGPGERAFLDRLHDNLSAAPHTLADYLDEVRSDARFSDHGDHMEALRYLYERRRQQTDRAEAQIWAMEAPLRETWGIRLDELVPFEHRHREHRSWRLLEDALNAVADEHGRLDASGRPDPADPARWSAPEHAAVLAWAWTSSQGPVAGDTDVAPIERLPAVYRFAARYIAGYAGLRFDDGGLAPRLADELTGALREARAAAVPQPAEQLHARGPVEVAVPARPSDASATAMAQLQEKEVRRYAHRIGFHGVDAAAERIQQHGHEVARLVEPVHGNGAPGPDVPTRFHVALTWAISEPDRVLYRLSPTGATVFAFQRRFEPPGVTPRVVSVTVELYAQDGQHFAAVTNVRVGDGFDEVTDATQHKPVLAADASAQLEIPPVPGAPTAADQADGWSKVVPDDVDALLRDAFRGAADLLGFESTTVDGRHVVAPRSSQVELNEQRFRVELADIGSETEAEVDVRDGDAEHLITLNRRRVPADRRAVVAVVADAIGRTAMHMERVQHGLAPDLTPPRLGPESPPRARRLTTREAGRTARLNVHLAELVALRGALAVAAAPDVDAIQGRIDEHVEASHALIALLGARTSDPFQQMRSALILAQMARHRAEDVVAIAIQEEFLRLRDASDDQYARVQQRLADSDRREVIPAAVLGVDRRRSVFEGWTVPGLRGAAAVTSGHGAFDLATDAFADVVERQLGIRPTEKDDDTPEYSGDVVFQVYDMAGPGVARVDLVRLAPADRPGKPPFRVVVDWHPGLRTHGIEWNTSAGIAPDLVAPYVALAFGYLRAILNQEAEPGRPRLLTPGLPPADRALAPEDIGLMAMLQRVAEELFDDPDVVPATRESLQDNTMVLILNTGLHPAEPGAGDRRALLFGENGLSSKVQRVLDSMTGQPESLPELLAGVRIAERLWADRAVAAPARTRDRSGHARSLEGLLRADARRLLHLWSRDTDELRVLDPTLRWLVNHVHKDAGWWLDDKVLMPYERFARNRNALARWALLTAVTPVTTPVLGITALTASATVKGWVGTVRTAEESAVTIGLRAPTVAVARNAWSMGVWRPAAGPDRPAWLDEAVAEALADVLELSGASVPWISDALRRASDGEPIGDPDGLHLRPQAGTWRMPVTIMFQRATANTVDVNLGLAVGRRGWRPFVRPIGTYSGVAPTTRDIIGVSVSTALLGVAFGVRYGNDPVAVHLRDLLLRQLYFEIGLVPNLEITVDAPPGLIDRMTTGRIDDLADVGDVLRHLQGPLRVLRGMLTGTNSLDPGTEVQVRLEMRTEGLLSFSRTAPVSEIGVNFNTALGLFVAGAAEEVVTSETDLRRVPARLVKGLGRPTSGAGADAPGQRTAKALPTPIHPATEAALPSGSPDQFWYRAGPAHVQLAARFDDARARLTHVLETTMGLAPAERVRRVHEVFAGFDAEVQGALRDLAHHLVAHWDGIDFEYRHEANAGHVLRDVIERLARTPSAQRGATGERRLRELRAIDDGSTATNPAGFADPLLLALDPSENGRVVSVHGDWSDPDRVFVAVLGGSPDGIVEYARGGAPLAENLLRETGPDGTAVVVVTGLLPDGRPDDPAEVVGAAELVGRILAGYDVELAARNGGRGLAGRDVTVIGAGRAGRAAAEMLRRNVENPAWLGAGVVDRLVLIRPPGLAHGVNSAADLGVALAVMNRPSRDAARYDDRFGRNPATFADATHLTMAGLDYHAPGIATTVTRFAGNSAVPDAAPRGRLGDLVALPTRVRDRGPQADPWVPALTGAAAADRALRLLSPARRRDLLALLDRARPVAQAVSHDLDAVGTDNALPVRLRGGAGVAATGWAAWQIDRHRRRFGVDTATAIERVPLVVVPVVVPDGDAYVPAVRGVLDGLADRGYRFRGRNGMAVPLTTDRSGLRRHGAVTVFTGAGSMRHEVTADLIAPSGDLVRIRLLTERAWAAWGAAEASGALDVFHSPAPLRDRLAALLSVLGDNALVGVAGSMPQDLGDLPAASRHSVVQFLVEHRDEWLAYQVSHQDDPLVGEVVRVLRIQPPEIRRQLLAGVAPPVLSMRQAIQYETTGLYLPRVPVGSLLRGDLGPASTDPASDLLPDEATFRRLLDVALPGRDPGVRTGPDGAFDVTFGDGNGATLTRTVRIEAADLSHLAAPDAPAPPAHAEFRYGELVVGVAAHPDRALLHLALIEQLAALGAVGFGAPDVVPPAVDEPRAGGRWSRRPGPTLRTEIEYRLVETLADELRRPEVAADPLNFVLHAWELSARLLELTEVQQQAVVYSLDPASESWQRAAIRAAMQRVVALAEVPTRTPVSREDLLDEVRAVVEAVAGELDPAARDDLRQRFAGWTSD